MIGNLNHFVYELQTSVYKIEYNFSKNFQFSPQCSVSFNGEIA